MPAKSTEPLTKVTLNLFTADVRTFQRRYGHGWSEQVRLILNENCKEYERAKRTIWSLVVQDMVDGEEE